MHQREHRLYWMSANINLDPENYRIDIKEQEKLHESVSVWLHLFASRS